MRNILIVTTCLFCLQAAHAKTASPCVTESKVIWGKTGHRVIGQIASFYLDAKAKKAVHHILRGKSIAIVSTWMDFIKSNPKWDYTHAWHWVTIPNGKTYAETKKNPDGDIIETLRRIIKELKQGRLSPKKERIDLKMLIHLVGDIHQPLHVGNGYDRGGNDVSVYWFGKHTDLHWVWDTGMIRASRLSYTELAKAINHVSEEQVEKWQSSTILDWARESKKLRSEVYDLPKDHYLGYDYMYKNWSIVKRRLLQAGIRLAGILNDIYG